MSTQEELGKAGRELDGWIGTTVRAARRVVMAKDSPEDRALAIKQLEYCLSAHDLCAKMYTILTHRLEIEQALAVELATKAL